MSARRNRSLGPAITARIANLVTRRSRLVIVVWTALVAVLAMQGRDAENQLAIHPLLVAGTAAERAHEISLREFGNEYPIIVLLRGPQAAVERQGRRLARRLSAVPRVLVISPWTSEGTIDGLNPRPGVAALLLRTASGEGDEVSGLLPPVQRQIDAALNGPVHASLAGLPVIIDSIRNSSSSASSTGELVAIPVLLFVLLFVFRSVLAAITPLLAGGMVVVVTRGLLVLISGFVELDLFVLVVSAMMGLALGVDYSLLVVSRFREEREHSDLPAAIQTTIGATSRSILPAGGALLLAMLILPVLLPGVLVRSVAIGVALATALSMFSAFCIVPALLTLFGRHLDRWSLPKRRPSSGAALGWSRRLRRQPGIALVFVFVLLLLSGFAFNLDSGVATAGLLPPEDPGRRQTEDVERALGPGWVAPMEIVVNGRGRPVTSPPRLRALAALQRHVEADPGVASTAGLVSIERGTRQLKGLGGELVRQERGLDRLKSGIVRLGRGAARGSAGLHSAARGSEAVASGVDAAGAGAGGLASGLQRTSAGSDNLSQGLDRAGEGSGAVADNADKASEGASKLAHSLAAAQGKTAEIQGSARLFRNAMASGNERLAEANAPLQATEEQLAAARQALQRMTTGRGDSEYAVALAAVEDASRRLTGTDPATGEPIGQGVKVGVERAEGQFGVGLYLAEGLDRKGRRASEGIEKLARGSKSLDRGLQRLAAGGEQVSEGIAALARGGQQLSPALRRLSDGAEHLTSGLGLLAGGSGRLASGLREGAAKSEALPLALHRIDRGLSSQRGAGAGAQLRRSPGLFRSGYFVLAALDGSSLQRRQQIGALINIDRGGTDARLLVIPRDDPTSDRARALVKRLEAEADELSRKTGTEAMVGGIGPATTVINDEFRGQAPLVRLALSLISLIILIPLLRSLVVPLLTVVINLIMVSATFGVLSLLFNNSLLGGPGYVDATMIPEIIIVIFALAIDYEVFIFARIREEYVRTGSTSAAVAGGLDRTAHVVTGAAIIMITVFLAFSISEFATIRNFGIAQTIAVFIDAFIVRLVVVPALMLWLGDRCWWMPRWLSRGRTPNARSPELRESG
ncbi:MAG: putative drug exporter of the superfamily [Solirubrobacterales bacterium]|jgi:RND superfamily putative drug exporter|nr:putative drug exporter of the superfamily [Solirubrobacterales bacterium]